MIQVIASVTVNPDEPKAFEDYFKVAAALLERVGAKISQKITLGDAVVGDRASELIIVVDYPSYDAIDAVFQSAEYHDIIGIRDKAFLKYNICIVDENEIVSG